MFTCSICGNNVDMPAMYSLDPTHPICLACVHKFDDLVKYPDDNNFVIAYDYFSSFLEDDPCDGQVKMALDHFLKQNQDKYQQLVNASTREKIDSFIADSNQEIAALKEEIEKIKQEAAEKEIQEKQQQEKEAREELLDSLGIYASGRKYVSPTKYAPNYYNYGFYKTDESDGLFSYYSKTPVKIFPEISDEELDQIKILSAEKEALEKERNALLNPVKEMPEKPFEETPPEPVAVTVANYSKNDLKNEPISLRIVKSDQYESNAAKFLRIIGVLTWVGGFIISLVISNQEVPYGYYSTRTEFSGTTFFISAFAFFLVGASYFGLAELFENLNTIAGILSDFRIDQYIEEKKNN